MGDPERQAKFAVSYLANSIQDSYETFKMRILTGLLTDGHASPFYRALIESNLGAQYAPGTGYDSSMPRAAWTIGVSGARPEDLPQVPILL